jgi:hypothetical protein
MPDPTKSPEMLAQLAAKALDTLTVWADANQRVMHELVNLSAATAKETGRLYGELQSSVVEVVRDSQAYWLKRQGAGPELPTDPILWYQKGLVEAIEGSQKALRFIETGAQAVTKSAEQVQAAAERSGKEIQATLSGFATRMHEIVTAA